MKPEREVSMSGRGEPTKTVVLCKQCGEPVEEARECYFTPLCYDCLPPPEPLPVNNPRMWTRGKGFHTKPLDERLCFPRPCYGPRFDDPAIASNGPVCKRIPQIYRVGDCDWRELTWCDCVYASDMPDDPNPCEGIAGFRLHYSCSEVPT